MFGGLSRLLKQYHFGPLFLTQFFGAFSDNLFRSGLLILVSYDAGISAGYRAQVLVTLIGALVILPFFLFSSLAGQICDKYEKSRVVRVIKTIEIAVMLLAIYGFATQNIGLLLSTLFLTMTQSAFFGPLKYSLLPVYLPAEEIVTGNALVETSTFLAILLGTLCGAAFIAGGPYGVWALGTVLMASTILGCLYSYRLPPASPSDPSLTLNWNLYQETVRIIRHAASDRVLFLCIIGISWFWVVGAMMVTHISTYGRDVIGCNQAVVTCFMILFTVGIGVGSAICHRWMRGVIDAHLVPWGCIGTTLFLIDFVIASNAVNIGDPEHIGIMQFFSHSNNWRITFDLLMIAVSSGLCMIPLYTILQTQAKPEECSRMIAANNIMNSCFMVLSSLVTYILIAFDITILNIFLVVGVLNLLAMYRLSSIVPESIVQIALQAALRLLYRVDVKGLEHYQNAGDRVLIIANHTSFLDAALIFAFIPEKLNYAIYTQYINKWWIRLIASGATLFPVDPTNPMATRKLIGFLRENKKCVIFPEGRITVTGSLMKIYDGPGMIADVAGATILPICIDGAQYSLFSRLKGKVRRRICPKITLTILPPYAIDVSDTLRGKERRRIISHQVYDRMVKMIFDTSPYQETLMSALIDSAKQHGMGRVIVEDTQRDPLTYRQLLMRIFLLGRMLTQKTHPGENVGVLLPTSVGGIVSFFALLCYGRVPAMLNFSLGIQNLIQTSHLARLKTVITSRRFVEMGRLQPLVDTLEKHVQLVYLEDLRETIGLADKLLALGQSFCPRLAYRGWENKISAADPAVILFTSGSEGASKGVVLTHQNINANRYQLMSVVDFGAHDSVLNVLPLFHSFGLTGGAIIPLLTGAKTFLYPSPLHHRIIPVMAYETNATIFFGTDTFLYRYGKAAHPYDFYAMRFVFAGAEKVRAETKQLWIEKFGIHILEAYGATEAAPGICINTRMNNKEGTVGKLLPGINYRLMPVEGLDQGGRLFIQGPNVMAGYLSPLSGQVVPTHRTSEHGAQELGWYDTGDIVDVDNQGYVTILGRAKRFAKIGGEMVSLPAIEERITALWPQDQHVVVSVPDAGKGEKLCLLTTSTDLTRSDLIKHLKQRGFSDLMIPREIQTVSSIPVLGTGKVDLVSIQQRMMVAA